MEERMKHTKEDKLRSKGRMGYKPKRAEDNSFTCQDGVGYTAVGGPIKRLVTKVKKVKRYKRDYI